MIIRKLHAFIIGDNEGAFATTNKPCRSLSLHFYHYTDHQNIDHDTLGPQGPVTSSVSSTSLTSTSTRPAFPLTLLCPFPSRSCHILFIECHTFHILRSNRLFDAYSDFWSKSQNKSLNPCIQHFFQVGTIPPTQYIPTLAPPPQPSNHLPMLPPHLPSAPHAPSSTMGKEDLATQPWQPSAPPDRWGLLPCISIYSTYSIYSPGCARFSIIFQVFNNFPGFQ